MRSFAFLRKHFIFYFAA